MRKAPRPGRAPGHRRHQATVALGFVTGMLSSLPHRHVDGAALLRRAGIDPDGLHQGASRVRIESYVALYNLLVQALEDEAFGLFSLPVRLGTMEFLGRSVLTSRNLGEVLDRGARFLGLVVPDLQVSVTSSEDVAHLRIRENRPLQAALDDPRRVFAFEWMLRLIHGLSCWMVRREIGLASVVFPYARPAHAADYDLIYTPLSIFNGTELVATLNANLLQLPVRRDEEELQAFLEGGPGKIATLYRRDREMVRRVREIVWDRFPEPVSLEDVALRLKLSTRSVHRRLHEESSSLRAIKDALRCDLALSRLAKTKQSIAQISSDLGYADPSTFFRAFTAWTGVSPSAFRRRLGGRIALAPLAGASGAPGAPA
jgi:AraC-like DNA-binding protein